MEIWKDIKGYEGYYQISNYGDVKSVERNIIGRNRKEIILKGGFDGKYFFVILQKNCIKKHFKIHRLVALNFIDNPLNKPEVNHIDGNKLNNHVNNLEWNTMSENQKHAFKIGLNSTKGEKHPRHKLTWNEVIFIRSLVGINQHYLARKFNISQATIWDILNFKTWKYA